ncbi:MAG: trypsin-like peptidase domain-containing protein [Dethiobacter sp.]|jgi:S1-C subfamily serine protease|nr:trypsin-like peptidase domain-containing protein [Dethiobacter sp.]
MDKFEGYNRKLRRPASPISCFVFGISGLIIGALLVAALFYCYILPNLTADPLTDPLKQDEADLKKPPSPHREDLAAVEVVNRVMPAVVAVNNYGYVTRLGQSALVERGSGSGVIVSPDGYIITNQHVINAADEIRVVLPDNGTMKATLVGEDVLTDLALLKIERDGLPYIPFGDSEATQVGESVFAVGNPLGFFQQTVTAGIISAVDRQVRIPDSQYAYTFIQTDAVINRGNSGGPLVNLRGEIIGINSVKVAAVGVEGIGLAIPSRTVRRVMTDLREYQRVRRPQLGILVEDLAQVTGDTADQGVHIREVIAGSAAEQAGLQAGDVIISIGTRPVQFLAQLFDTLLEYYPGDHIEITVLRDNTTLVFNAVLGEMQ